MVSQEGLRAFERLNHFIRARWVDRAADRNRRWRTRRVKAVSGSNVTCVRGRAKGPVRLQRLQELHGVVILAGWTTGLSILSVQKQLRTQITSGRRIRSALCMANEAALLAQNGTFLHTLIADSAYDG